MKTVKTLSPREIEVLQLLSMGFCIMDIAEKLSISIGVTRNYAQAARCKLGAYSTAHAVRIGIEKGIIEV